MANTSRANGLRPVSMITGAAWNGVVNQYLVPSTDNTAIYVGDPVKSGGTAGAAGVVVNGQDVSGMPTVTVAAAGDTLKGVVVGFLPKQSDLTVQHREASTNRIALVVDDPNVVFEVQEDAVGATTALVDVGENADLIYAAGSTTTGQSGVMLDSSDHKTATAQLRILGFVKRPDNEPAVANAKLLVLINEHEFKSTSGV
jgi:hypothetical protein